MHPNGEIINTMRAYQQIQRKHSPLVRLIRLLLFFGLIFVCAIAFWKLPFFRIRAVECTVDEKQTCIDGVREEVERKLGEHILFAKTEEAESKIQRAVAQIQTVRIKKKFPGTLFVDITMKEPACFVQSENAPNVYKVDEEGNIYAYASDDKPPIVVMFAQSDNVSLGGKIQKETVTLLSLLSRQLSSFPKLVTSIYFVSDSEIRLSFEDGTKALMKGENPQEQLNTLQRILNDATIVTQGRTIDVRFDHPVVQ